MGLIKCRLEAQSRVASVGCQTVLLNRCSSDCCCRPGSWIPIIVVCNRNPRRFVKETESFIAMPEVNHSAAKNTSLQDRTTFTVKNGGPGTVYVSTEGSVDLTDWIQEEDVREV